MGAPGFRERPCRSGSEYAKNFLRKACGLARNDSRGMTDERIEMARPAPDKNALTDYSG